MTLDAPGKMAFAHWLQARFDEKGWQTLRQGELYLGVGRSSLSDYLSGRTWPNRRTLKKIATFFNVSIQDLDEMIPDIPSVHSVRQSEVVLTLGRDRMTMPVWLHVWLNELEERGLTPEELASALEIGLRYVRSRAGGHSSREDYPGRDTEDSKDSDPSLGHHSAGDVGEPEEISREHWR